MSGIIFGSGITLSAGIVVGQGSPATSGGYIDLFGKSKIFVIYLPQD